MEIAKDKYYKWIGKGAPLIGNHLIKIKSVTFDRDGEPYIETYQHGYYTGPYFRGHYDETEAPDEEVPKLTHIRSLHCVDCGSNHDVSEYFTDCSERLVYCEDCSEEVMNG